ncbi:NAD(P)-binding protein [Daedalea quercina L-15889]|uniref:NAD(P)-binding protein n=1 Tax=Daedalea quercina L-15889 TaxID=1314783 RepID=A0A165MSQ2_9APHY|nr:NAD(P)-binding protein [Daedalea quercina L-15889]
MAPSSYTRVVLAERPQGAVDSKTFRVEEVPFALKPASDEVLVKADYLSLDPAMRIWLNAAEANYTTPVEIGETMRAIGLGTVIEAGQNSGFSVGDHVSGMVGLSEYNVLKAAKLTKVDLPAGAQLLDALGPLGHPGLTAYIGIIYVGQIKAGETLVVSGAAGATGSLVCQLAKDRGAKVYGTAGSAEKCRYLEEELGVTKALNYKSPTFHEDFAREIGTFDVLFDNVGGDFLDFALTRMNRHARVILCGAISGYNSKPAPVQNFSYIFLKAATVQAFSLNDHGDRLPEGLKYLTERIARGAIKYRYHVVEGIKEAPRAINMLFTGENNGKLVIKA